MWKAVAFSEGEWRELPVLALEGVPFTSSALLDLARTSAPLSDSRLVQYLAQESELPGASQDAIELWAATAAAESREFDWDSPYKVEAVEEALALYPQSAGPTAVTAANAVTATAATPVTMTWHDRTAAIIQLPSGTEQVTVEYVPSLADELRVERLQHRYGTNGHRLESIFEWRSYHGQKSAIVDHWTAMRSAGRGLTASVWGTGNFLIGAVVRRLTLEQPSFDRDPTHRKRLVSMLQRHPHIEAQCPDLERITAVRHDRAVVFVHGTVSCGVQGLKDLLLPPPAPPPGSPMYRFEHDTFRPIEENAAGLADLISARLDASHLLIAAHSRGGIVARGAAAILANKGYGGSIEVCTFGTPHLGTPLVAMGGRLLNLLFKLGEEVVGSVPVVSSVSKAMGYLIDTPGLPPGIEAMGENAPGLAWLNTIGDRVPIRAWGSAFDLAAAPSGFGIGLEGALAGAMADRKHDLVVPTASALAVGIRQPILACSHLHYFTDPAVRTAITAFLTPPGATQLSPGAKTAAPAPAGAAQPAGGAAAIGTPTAASVIGGISVMRPLTLKKTP